MSDTTWDPEQYLRHADHRTRALRDLLARVPNLPGDPPRITDLGCGPGNTTALLADRWPTALVTGLDNSAEMLAAARRYAGPTPGGGRVDFRPADATEWSPSPDEPCDLIVTNAALQWVPGHPDRFPDWIAGLAPGGVLALQVPDNFDAPTHTLLAELLSSPRWKARLGRLAHRPVHILDPAGYLDRLVALGCTADVWQTTYLQLLQGEDAVLEWTKGTALRPALTALADDPAAREELVGQYRDLLRGAYPPGPAGTVLPFRRTFAVARKEA
ncbi:trans-aconitate 2-methyltransferase [Streptomyces thermolineatus]|uniref:Trans-aconitate 2-methyltransferase n=1 Tax=Streptomyces thermolineatus TaxID=44033 RepID=A0ABN3MNA7_9ACTN